MRYGAVIVAAGMSTRMKQFKQLMEVDHMTLAERVVKTFQHAGIRDIVMVTGYRAEEVEHALRKLGIVFLRNEAYADTQMLDSAKIGFRYMNGKADRIFFCPADVPFFTEKTVRLEMTRDEEIVYPVCHNRLGHPIVFDGDLLGGVLAYDGPRGLKGALDTLSTGDVCFLPVSDEGAVMDADTPNDLAYLKKLAGRRTIHAESHVMLTADGPFFGEGTITLLKQIEHFHSVREACEQTGISYSKAWKILHTAEAGFGFPLVDRKAGGNFGDDARLTDRGRNLLILYEELETHAADYVEQEFCRLFPASMLIPESDAGSDAILSEAEKADPEVNQKETEKEETAS